MKETIIVIPSYEPPRIFIDYVKKLLSAGASKVIVINDGSSEKYNGVYDEIKNIENTILLEYKENHGKGYALKFAFNYIKSNFSDEVCIVTADCDGQHSVEDVFNLAKTASLHPNDLILGARDFKKDNVPTRSRFGNLNTRRMFRLLYGLKVTDTQTGLRAFCTPLIDKMLKINGDRFEYEMNMLIVLYKDNVNFIEVPIETIYEEKQSDVEKRSHFKTISDSIKVWSVLFKNLNFYLIASAISIIIEIGLFAICQYQIYQFIDSPALITLFSSITARVSSSLANYFINYKFVFNGQGKSAILRYYVLWTCSLTLSYLLTNLFGNVLGLPIVLFKMFTDIFLSLFNYRIQTVWVFPHGCKHKEKK